MDEATRQFYARNAQGYVEAGSDQPGDRLLAFLVALPPRARILELGAGSGRDAAAMLARGFEVDATDGSSELAAQATRRIGKPVRIMTFDALESEADYDAVWACASLLHAPATELTGILAAIHRAMRPGALFVASFKAGTGEGRDGFGRYYNYPSAEALTEHYRDAAPWADLSLEPVEGSGYDKLPTQWLWVNARKEGCSAD